MAIAPLPVRVECGVRVEFAAFPPEQAMEAERLNSIESSLDDLDGRARELRRYL
jgi:hypothetical protein